MATSPAGRPTLPVCGDLNKSGTITSSQTIVLPDASCNAAPCVVDAIFLPSASADYWTATSYDPTLLSGYAYTWSLFDGNVDNSIKDYSLSVRAVRTK